MEGDQSLAEDSLTVVVAAHSPSANELARISRFSVEKSCQPTYGFPEASVVALGKDWRSPSGAT